jgi:hypothetical protein
MLMCIGRDTIDKDDKLTSYPELCHGERICCVEEFRCSVGLTVVRSGREFALSRHSLSNESTA